MAEIVVGVDGSESSADATRWALEMGARLGDSVRLVCAYEFPAAWLGMGEALGSSVAPSISTADLEAYALASIEEVLARIEIPDGVSVVREAHPGHPADVLVRLSADADLLVVGSKGHGDFGSVLLGSVGLHCVHHAQCPVVTMAHPHRRKHRKAT